MSINLTVPSNNETPELKPRITVIGVGGAGGNAVNNMIQSGLEGVDFLVANSDAQALAHSQTDQRIQMGINATRGLGAGSNPEIGRAAAEESLSEILAQLELANMVFITAGLGGGTGTGAAPVIAQATRERGMLTVGVVTKPFHFEGANRMKIAEAGLTELQQYVDTLLVIPNQNLFRVANEQTTFADAFKMADDVLYSGVRGVTDLMVMPGLINLDFADIRSVMAEMGKAMMGTGEAEGERRAIEAAEAAIANPLLDDISMKGAKGVLINITAGKDITLFEVDEAANRIRDEVDADANIIFGSTFDEALEGRIRVSVVATGIEAAAGTKPQPIVHRVTEAVAKAAVPEAPAKAQSEAEPVPVALFPERTPVPVGEPGSNEEPATVAAASEEDAEDMSDTDAGADMDTATAARALASMASASPVEVDEQARSGGDEPFIPNAPVTAAAVAPEAAPDPFAAAEMVNAQSGKAEAAAAPKSKRVSLFERVTGVGRPERREPQPPARPVAEVPAELAAESQLAEEAETPQPEVKPARTLMNAYAGSGTADGGGEDEDLLEIPAFLRRQAN